MTQKPSRTQNRSVQIPLVSSTAAFLCAAADRPMLPTLEREFRSCLLPYLHTPDQSLGEGGVHVQNPIKVFTLSSPTDQLSFKL